MLNWVNSTGGPLLCGETAVLTKWNGTARSATSDDEVKSDYERACATTAYLEVIAIGGASALVLGDEPMQSAFVSKPTSTCLARWIAAPSLEAAETVLMESDIQLTEIGHAVRFDVVGRDICLVDSAATWVEGETYGAFCKILPGSYLITTEELISPDRSEFIIHRFLLR